MVDSKKIVDHIESGEWNDAKEAIFDGIKGKAAETVDMKRLEISTDWVSNPSDSTE